MQCARYGFTIIPHKHKWKRHMIGPKKMLIPALIPNIMLFCDKCNQQIVCDNTFMYENLGYTDPYRQMIWIMAHNEYINNK